MSITTRNIKGLTAQQVIDSRNKFGSNEITPPERDPWWKLLLEKFDDPIIRILMIAAVIAIGVGFINGEYFEGIGIIIAIFLATTLAFINEFKAGKEFDILNKVSDENLYKVIRDGSYTSVSLKDIVVGDIIILEAGEEVPADGRLLEAISLQIDEAKLTGESLPVAKFAKDAKAAKATEEDDQNAYDVDFLLRSTMVFDGHGIFEISAVGDATEIGKASRSATEQTDEPTPLNRQLDKLSKIIGVVGFSIAFMTFMALVARDYTTGELNLAPAQWGFSLMLFICAMIGLSRVWLPILADAFELAGRRFPFPGLLRGTGLKDWLKSIMLGIACFALCIFAAVSTGYLPSEPSSWLNAEAIADFLKFFMIAVTIIVVAVPEGLPMSVTLSLAYSMRKMTAANNLVRRMHACETIGAATVICSDKTGTLTQNKMVLSSAHFPALGSREPEAKLASDVEKVVVESIAANSTANLSRDDSNKESILGNPTEGATLLWLNKNGIDYLEVRQKFEIEKQWTFSTERKMMGSYGLSGAGNEKILYVKGAPEIIMNRCDEILTENGLQQISHFSGDIKNELKAQQARGMRTLAFAFKRCQIEDTEGDLTEVANSMVWLGFVSIADPIRPEVPMALEVCRKAGVAVKIITGDNSNTAWEIANQIGLITDGDDPDKVHMTGSDFQALPESEAMEVIQKIKILSRARPADKLKMVKLLQKADEVVAVTGDGTNDAPALNHANVGLAMGKTGTAVAREASDIILLDDSFPSVVKGIMWGRSLYENIQRFVMFQLTINVVALAIALTGPFIGIKMPLTVIQMLWVNLIMDTFAALALATEPPHWKVMSRPPRAPKDFLVTRSMYTHIFGVGAIFYVLLLGILKFFQKDGTVNTAELSIFFTTFVMLQFWNMFNARALGLKHSALKGITQNKGFIAILPAILFIQFLIVQYGRTMFRTEPLPVSTWLIIIAGTSLVLWVGEASRLLGASEQVDEIPDKCPFD